MRFVHKNHDDLFVKLLKIEDGVAHVEVLKDSPKSGNWKGRKYNFSLWGHKFTTFFNPVGNILNS